MSTQQITCYFCPSQFLFLFRAVKTLLGDLIYTGYLSQFHSKCYLCLFCFILRKSKRYVPVSTLLHEPHQCFPFALNVVLDIELSEPVTSSEDQNCVLPDRLSQGLHVVFDDLQLFPGERGVSWDHQKYSST